jgi:undecaprenyl-diphosphatase
MSGATDLVVTAMLVLVTAALFFAMATEAGQAWFQKIDDRFLEWMVAIQSPFLTAVAKVLSVMGGALVTFPVRLGVAGFLAWRRRWWHFAAFVSAIVLSEISISVLKNVYDRTRPPNPLVVTSGASFPSGHAVATSVTVIAMGIALFPPKGVHRWLWGIGGVLFSYLMALSRTYLHAHWLSDVLAGVLLGTTIAMVCALVVEAFRHEEEGDPPGFVDAQAQVEQGLTQPAQA